LKSDGTVRAWGYNTYGQLGDGTATNRSTPVWVLGLAGAKYYFFNGQRVAMKKEGVLYYLAGDHLGTTSVVICGQAAGCSGVPLGELVAESRHCEASRSAAEWTTRMAGCAGAAPTSPPTIASPGSGSRPG
jgi:hypothetical protein